MESLISMTEATQQSLVFLPQPCALGVCVHEQNRSLCYTGSYGCSLGLRFLWKEEER